MQQKMTAQQNQQYPPNKVVTAKIINKDNHRKFLQGRTKHLTGDIEVRIVGHGNQVNGINTLEGRNSEQIMKIIREFIPEGATLRKVFLFSCNSASCLNEKLSLVQEIQKLVDKFVEVVGYQGTVNVDENGDAKIVANGKPGMAPSDIDSFGWLVLRFLLLVFAVQLLGCLLVFFSLMLQRFVVLALSYLVLVRLLF
jgi:hypothetical protein